MKMSKFTINYNNGFTRDVDGDLDMAKIVAVEGLSYTQASVSIQDENGETVARLPWYGLEPSEDDEVVEQFGSFGFYSAWE
jgi:hypothetical protein